MAEIPEDITGLTGVVEETNLYFIKGAKPLTMGGEPLKEVKISNRGLKTVDSQISDRELVLVLKDSGVSNGQEFTHRAIQQIFEPRMSLVSTDYDGAEAFSRD